MVMIMSPGPQDKCSRETGSGQKQEQSSGHLCPRPQLWSAVCQTCSDFLKNLRVQISLYHVATLSSRNGLLFSFFPVLHAYVHLGVLQWFRRLTPGVFCCTSCRAPLSSLVHVAYKGFAWTFPASLMQVLASMCL